MHLPAAMCAPSSLARAAVVFGFAVGFTPGRAAAQPPGPVAPTVPAPRVSAYLPALVASKAAARPDAEPNGDKDEKADAPKLGLAECIAVAIERQPSLRAVRASQQATGAGLHALNNIGRIGSALSPDLPIRREQSTRGVIAAAADVQKMHNEIVHDVTRLYYTAVYARQQSQIAEDVVAQLELLVEIARKLLASPNPGEMTRAKLDAMEIGLAEARGLTAQARMGEKQAYAALREIMAVQTCVFPFRVRDDELPVMAQNVPLTKELVVELALCRRPELALAAAGADAFRLEVYAQGAIRYRRTVPTLGTGSDIKAREVPSATRDPAQQYRPGAIIPEMPPQLIGSVTDRVARAQAFSQRADAVYEKARNLVILEAETTFYNFEYMSERVGYFKTKFDRGRDLMERVREGADNPKAPKDQLVLGYAQAAKAQSDYVEAVFQHLLALAALERVTAGGVRPAFPGR